MGARLKIITHMFQKINDKNFENQTIKTKLWYFHLLLVYFLSVRLNDLNFWFKFHWKRSNIEKTFSLSEITWLCLILLRTDEIFKSRWFESRKTFFSFPPLSFFIKLHKKISFTVYRVHKKTNLGQNNKTTRQKSSIIHQLFCDFLIPEAFQIYFQISKQQI